MVSRQVIHRMHNMLRLKHLRSGLSLLTAVVIVLFLCGETRAETYGIMSDSGEFQPKVTIDISSKEILITKLDPQEKFRSISLQINRRNPALMHNAGLLKIEWMDAQRHAGRPVPFTGPRYDPNTRTFEDSMVKSVSLKIINASARKLFEDKPLSELFEIKINGQPIVSAESVEERTQTVQMGRGRDLSINVDRDRIVFTENNVKVGEIFNVDNRSGKEQVLGVDLPKTGWLLYQLRRKPEQTEIPSDEWNRFTVPADSGVFVVLIPDADPALLAQLDGKEIVIKVYQGDAIRETRKIPIKVAADLRRPEYFPPREAGPISPEPVQDNKISKTKPQAAPASRVAVAWGSWVWGLVVVNFLFLVGLVAYGLLFLIPRLQVLDDRLTKNEMFIHGSREAIREELEQIKEEILRQCQRDAESP